ncbi:uncharacterized protein TNCV_5140271 [Trichonephila clavipes]|nr:uncharacterized protein TNCV_5140271 [Trichonephila clavipes]
MDKTTFSSIEEQQIVPDSARYFIMRTTETFSKVSPFLIEKAISGSIGAVKTICKMRTGDLFIEVSSSQQASALTKLRHLATIDVTVVAHRSLNYSRGVISAADLLHVSPLRGLPSLEAGATLMLLASIGDESPMCLPCVETRVPGKEGPGN